MKFFTKENVFLKQNLNSQNEVFNFIATQAKKLALIIDEKMLISDLNEREKQVSTGLEDEFAIPHTQSDTVLKPSLFFISTQNGIDWSSFDKSLAKYFFVILLPKNNSDIEQIEMLTRISKILLDKSLIEQIKEGDLDQTFSIINEFVSINMEKKEIKSDKIIVGVTSCPVGIAHTYLAAEKLEQILIEKGYKPFIETRGSVGPKNVLTQEQINKAEFVIVATDIQVDSSAFDGKKVFFTSTKEAIHNTENVVSKAKNATIYKYNGQKTDQKKDETSFFRHIITGISYMIPYVIFGGIMIALSLGIGKAIYGNNAEAPRGDFLWWMLQIGIVSFNAMIGILGGFIAFSIAGRAAIMPGFVVSTIANNSQLFYNIGGINAQTPMGFIGSILFGFLIGYTVKYLANLKIQKPISSIIPMFIIPIGVTLFYAIIVIFLIGAPIGWVNDKFISSLKSLFLNKNGIGIGLAVVIGALLGAMIGFDMGGPINKVAFLTSTALVSAQVFEPMGIAAAAIPVAPLGMGLATIIFRKKFNSEQKSLGASAIIMGFIGISEGAIPFAVADPKRVIFANVVGSAVAGAIAGGLSVTNQAGHGGPIVALLGAIGSNIHGTGLGIAFFFLAVIVGSIVTMLIYGLSKDRKIFSSFTKKVKYAIKKR
ncbi:fructose-specific PTS transporter subunit EIIC [Mycoplasma sp. 'Moose RK']|uniref:PTS fructose transporter subunit IIABC n=1 Tax=Mycoplasma sp. 'Moose RK' TaxID=2780095 RepID=UPI0018C329D1|nr:fructose-specific PTS transporter subunit EIIC [Mycoplasma sp. 'Moose RK']MBG0730849.1 PTS sugar transporter subunit IIA [Mycoplasma sp. 'Moose RK']